MLHTIKQRTVEVKSNAMYFGCMQHTLLILNNILLTVSYIYIYLKRIKRKVTLRFQNLYLKFDSLLIC